MKNKIILSTEKIVFINSLALIIAITLMPDQFLFSKIVPTSFWTEYLPMPFGAGWLISFIVLIPAMWLSPFRQTLICIMPLIIAVILLAVPFAMLCNSYSLTLNNLLGQYIWLVIICVPPCAVHLILRGVLLLRKSQPT